MLLKQQTQSGDYTPVRQHLSDARQSTAHEDKPAAARKKQRQKYLLGTG
jgi:hypothetical protein